MLASLSISLLYTLVLAAKSQNLNYTTSESGNPFVLGSLHDPASVYYNASDSGNTGLYWVFAATHNHEENDTTTPTITAFSSGDLVDWEMHENVLNMSSFTWANASIFSPSPIFSDGLYYLYFSASGHPAYQNETSNDLSRNSVGNYSGIGVGAARKPEGPYTNVLEDLVGTSIPTSLRPYGPSILADHDSRGNQRVYIYYGIQNSLFVRELDRIPATFKNESRAAQLVVGDNTSFEGLRVFKRRDTYYLLWNSGASSPPKITYASSTSPLGPFSESKQQQWSTVLTADSTVANNVYHADVLGLASNGETDEQIWYLVYHRMQSLSKDFWISDTDPPKYEAQGLAYDRLFFDDSVMDRQIVPVEMQVKNNFQRTSYWNSSIPLGWTLFGSGETSLVHEDTGPSSTGESIITSLQVDCSSSSCQKSPVTRLAMPTNFTSIQFTVGISMKGGGSSSSSSSPGSFGVRPGAGIFFRGTKKPKPTKSGSADFNSDYQAYYAGLTFSGQVTLGKVETVGNGNGGNFHEFQTKSVGPDFRPEAWHYLRVKADGDTITVLVDNFRDEMAMIWYKDGSLLSGWTGLSMNGVEFAKFTGLEITTRPYPDS